ncbi:MAG: DNA-binding protein [Acidimicrobiales bacterium]|nr:DNA-binding protein [Acidimicrobiales bacterium]
MTAPPPGYRGEVPYGFGVVELPEGLRVLTRLTRSDPAQLRFGQDVTMQVVPLHTDDDGNTVVSWAFG